MNRLWCSIAASLAAALTSFGIAAETHKGTGAPVVGEMVDADLPATYRLPPVSGAPQPTTAAEPVLDAVPAVETAPELPAAVAPQAIASETTFHSSPPDAGMNAGAFTDAPVVRLAEAALHAGTRASQVAEAKPKETRAGGVLVQAEMHRRAPRTLDLTTQLLPAVQRGFGLAQRGALYAARTEFVQVLRRVAQGQDAAFNTNEHSQALAAGLRSLDEAEDFVPEGVQLEAELDVRKTASSHRTDVLPEELSEVSPLEAVSLYHNYAEEQLRKAVAGEQAGSMALHGLGTVYARLAARNDEDVQLTRGAMTMYTAALNACPENHLAANELGVLVCRSGRPEKAAALFMQAIDFAPSAVAYHNLAIALQKSGLMAQAAANETESQRLAAMERARGDVSRRAGVQWVTPEEMARASQPIHRTAAPAMPPMPPQTVPPSKSAWQKVVDTTKSLPFPGGRARQGLGPMPEERIARPMANGAGNQSQWR